MPLPDFDIKIPISSDPMVPNRYGYTRLVEISEAKNIEFIIFDTSDDSKFNIDASNRHCLYTYENPNDMVYACLVMSNGYFRYTYLTKPVQEYLKKCKQENTVIAINVKDFYLCLENYIDERLPNGIGCRFVIDCTKYGPAEHTKDEIKKEIEELVEFFKSKNFINSSQVSNYIREYKLGNKYPHISGYLTMRNSDTSWVFEGGISPEYYAEICRKLNITSKKTKTEVLSFTSYEDNNNK